MASRMQAGSDLKSHLVTNRAKLRIEMPEMDAPTPFVSLLDTFASLRSSTIASASEPSAEQLLADYKSLGGIPRCERSLRSLMITKIDCFHQL